MKIEILNPLSGIQVQTKRQPFLICGHLGFQKVNKIMFLVDFTNINNNNNYLEKYDFLFKFLQHVVQIRIK